MMKPRKVASGIVVAPRLPDRILQLRPGKSIPFGRSRQNDAYDRPNCKTASAASPLRRCSASPAGFEIAQEHVRFKSVDGLLYTLVMQHFSVSTVADDAAECNQCEYSVDPGHLCRKAYTVVQRRN